MTLQLAPLPEGQRIVDPETGLPTLAFSVYWQRFRQEIEAGVNAAGAIMSDIRPITITADYQGVVNAGQLPRSVRAYRYDAGTDVSEDSTWSVEVSDGLTATVDLTGLITITAIVAPGTIIVTSIHNGIERSKTILVSLSVSRAPSTGATGPGGGTTTVNTAFDSFNSATHLPVSEELTVEVGSSGNVNLSAYLTVHTGEDPPDGTFAVYGEWEWYDGAIWQDVSAETISNPHSAYSSVIGVREGALNVQAQKTGLTPGATEKFRLTARNISGTRTMYLSGEASAVAA